MPYGETVTKNIILCDFSLERWGILKTYSTDSIYTGSKDLEWMICSWVCSASSSENDEFSVFTRFPMLHHIILWSEITEIMCGTGRMHFVLPL